MLISGKIKENSRTNRNSFQHCETCIICANTKCKQSTDHQALSFRQFKDISIKARGAQPQIQEVKQKIKEYYKTLKAQFIQYAEKSCLCALENINLYYYSHLRKLKPEELKILSQVLENDPKSLPSKKVWAIATALKDICNQRQFFSDNLKFQCQFSEILSEIQSQLKKLNTSEFGQSLKNYMIKFQSQYEKQEKLTSSSLACSKSSRFSECSSNEDQIFQWKNLRIRNIVKNVVLNCKKIDDTQLIVNLPKLKQFSNIIQFQARENLITSISCTGITNYLPQLLSLDLRSNNIGDTGVNKLKNMVNLKQLMINRNGVTDRAAQYIFQGFPSLQVLWIDENNLTQKGAFILTDKQILKICSVVGNSINQKFYSEIKSLFSRKGLIYI